LFLFWGIWAEMKVLLLMLLSAFVLSVISSIIHKYKPNKGLQKNKDAKSDVIRKPAHENISSGYTTNIYLRIFALSAIFLFILNSVSSSLGEAQAKQQIQYLTISKPQYLVVLRMYGDNFICQPLMKTIDSNNATWILSGNITVVKSSDASELVLEDTGSLIKN
jgi:hypothetical protein